MKLIDVRVRFPRSSRSLGPWNLEGPDDVPWLITGPSGSGKTTFLKTLCNRVPYTGRVEGAPASETCAFLPQFPERVLMGRNLAEDLTGVLNPDSETRSAVRGMLSELGVAASLHREASSLSGGEKRRLLWALLDRTGWETWAWDEPEAGLDVDGRRLLLAWLRRAVKREGAHWMGTNAPWMYLALNPFCVVLEKGAVIFAGTRDEALSRRDVRTALGYDTHPSGRVWCDIANETGDLDGNVWKKLSLSDVRVSQLQVLLRDSEVVC